MGAPDSRGYPHYTFRGVSTVHGDVISQPWGLTATLLCVGISIAQAEELTHPSLGSPHGWGLTVPNMGSPRRWGLSPICEVLSGGDWQWGVPGDGDGWGRVGTVGNGEWGMAQEGLGKHGATPRQ